MSFLIDTNTLLRAAQPQHLLYGPSVEAIAALRRQGEKLSLVPQNLVEFWAVASRPVEQNVLGLTADQTAVELSRLKQFFAVLPDTADIHAEWERLVIQYKVLGKKAHDARLVAAMNVHGIKSILTFNVDDFKRYPSIQPVHPQRLPG